MIAAATILGVAPGAGCRKAPSAGTDAVVPNVFTDAATVPEVRGPAETARLDVTVTALGSPPGDASSTRSAGTCVYQSHSVFHLRARPVSRTAGSEEITTRPRMEVLRSTELRRANERMYFVHFLDGTDRRGWMYIPVFELVRCPRDSTPLIALDGSEPLPASTVPWDPEAEDGADELDDSPGNRCLTRCGAIFRGAIDRCTRAPPLAVNACMQSANGTFLHCTHVCSIMQLRR